MISKKFEALSSFAELWFRSLRYRFLIDSAELKVLSKLVAKGNFCVDVGSHKGAYFFLFRRWVGPSGQVLGFEPQAELFEYLRTKVSLLGWKNARVESLCLSNLPGKTLFYRVAGRSSTGASLNQNVFAENSLAVESQVTTLDLYLQANRTGLKVDFLKLDVESFEYEVLQGSAQTLDQDSSAVFFEGESRISGEQKVLEIFQFLQNKKYRGYFFFDGKTLPVDQFSFEKHQDISTPGFPNSRLYSNNFLFVKRPEHRSLLET